MNRRKFLQSLPTAAALGSANSTWSQTSHDADIVTNHPASITFVVPGPITGPLAGAMQPPQGDPPLPQSPFFKGLRFTGKQRQYKDLINGDTWYPSWSPAGTLYSSYTDGGVRDGTGRVIRSESRWPITWRPQGTSYFSELGLVAVEGRITSEFEKYATTGNAILLGNDPFNLTVRPLEPFRHSSPRFEGYYPSGNLFYKGIWYYGGYYCHLWLNKHNIGICFELGGFGGFRISEDCGKTWRDTIHNDQHPLFPETGRCVGAAPIKLGAPHFVDFGRDLEHSPDGYAYLVGHGTYDADGICNWSSGDAISMARLRPSPQTINDPMAYEFFAGHDVSGQPIWTKDFSKIASLISWPGGAGCVNITYHSGLKRYFGFICGAWADGSSGSYNTWVVESVSPTGPWFTVTNLRGTGGGQAYFMCMPSKFNQGDSRKLTLFYSSNWSPLRPGIPSWSDKDGPGGSYTLCVAEFELM